MPTYSYRCTECSNAFDIHQAFTDDTLTVCPTCGGALRKIFSPVGVTFSGSGFYRTDSRTAPKSEASGSSASSASSASASDSGSSSAPAAAKTEKKSTTPAASSSSAGGSSS